MAANALPRLRRVPCRQPRVLRRELRERLRAPVLCNQWGVKDEVGHAQGRLDYAAALLSAFKAHNISATYWIWRSYAKGGRDVQKDEWGYELVHNPGHDDQGHLLPEYIEPAMTSVLQQGFARTNPSPSQARYQPSSVLSASSALAPCHHGDMRDACHAH